MAGFSALTLKQACLKAMVREEGQQLTDLSDLPHTLGRELEAARRVLGHYRFTGIRVDSAVEYGVEVTGEERDRLTTSFYAALSGRTKVVGVGSSTEKCWAARCPHSVYRSTYFEEGRLIKELRHLHRATMPGWEERLEKENIKDSYYLEQSGELVWTSIINCKNYSYTIEKRLQRVGDLPTTALNM
jgi:hypothetical protein